MAWIELHDTIGTHKKTYSLAASLGISHASAVGTMVLLWTWAINNVTSGNLAGYPSEAVARACFWEGDPDTLMSALHSCGWIDENDDIHDWADYAGRLINKRAQNASRMRLSRERAAHVQRTCNARAENVRDTCCARAGATVPNHIVTVVNTTKEDDTEVSSMLSTGFCRDEDLDELVSQKEEIEAVLNAAQDADYPHTKTDCDNLIALRAQYGTEAVLRAIATGSEYELSKRTVRYLKGILKRDPTGGSIENKNQENTVPVLGMESDSARNDCNSS